MKIKNRGDAGYQSDLYGDAIIVARAFNRAGTSGCKLKSSTGKIMSTRKADLDDIGDYFAHSLDNPMTVLSQDMARSFLSTSSPQEKYKFFVKGVNLEQLHKDYELLNEYILQCDDTYKEQEEVKRKLGEKAIQAKQLFDLAGKQDSMRDRMRDLGLQMAWAQVQDQEKQLDNMVQNIRDAENTLDHAQREANESETAFDKSEEDLTAAQQAVRGARDEKAPLDTERSRIKESRDNVMNRAKELQVS